MNSTSRAPRCRTTVLNTSVCMKPTRCTSKLRFLFLCTNIFLAQRSKSNWPPTAVMPVRVKNSTTGAWSDSGKCRCVCKRPYSDAIWRNPSAPNISGSSANSIHVHYSTVIFYNFIFIVIFVTTVTLNSMLEGRGFDSRWRHWDFSSP